MSEDWLWDGSGEPHLEDERIAKALAGLAYEGEPPALPAERPTRRPWVLGAGFTALLLAAMALLALLSPPPTPENPVVEPIIASATPWGIEPVQGVPSCGDAPVTGDRRLDLGSWLTTDPDDAARVTVADLGFMEVAPNTSVRLVSSTSAEHRLELAHGKVEIQVKAPPRVLVIDTPGGELVDLGCAYTAEMAANGYGELAVDDGWVAIEHPVHTVLVPEGASAKTRGALGPTVPVFRDADPELAEKAMLAATESWEADSLTWVVMHSRPRDTLTLVHLLERVGVPERQLLYGRIVDLAGPVSTTEEEVVRLDRAALGRLLDEVSARW